MIRSIILISLLFAGAGASAGLTPMSRSSATAPMVNVGDAAPCVELNHLNYNGTETKRTTCAAEHKEQNLVLSFFATWCEYCVADLPVYTKIATKFKGQAVFRLIGVDKEESMRAYFKGRDFSMFEIGFDPTLASFNAFGLEGTPTLVVIGPNGKVKYIYVGEIMPKDEPTVEANILK